MERRRVGSLDGGDESGGDADLIGVAEIAGQHRADFAEPSGAGDVVDQARERRGLGRHARRPPVAGMPGEHNGRHEDHRKSQPLQSEDAGAPADGATRNQAADDDDRCFRHEGTLVHRGGI